MWKKLIIKIALSMVLDLLLGIATRKYEEAELESNRLKWLNIIQFLGEIKTVGLP